MSDPFIGEIRAFAFTFEPVGWMACDGRLLPIQQYQPLFALLGRQFGGDGVSNFALPNLKGRFILGTKPAQSSDPGHPFAELAGAETVTLTVNQMPSHVHSLTLAATLNGSESPADQTSPGGGALAAPESNPIYTTATPNKPMATGSAVVTGSAGSTGGNQPHPNLPPFTSLNYCIAFEGIFPSRD